MAKYGSDDVTIEYDNVGGSLVDMSAYVDTINGVKIAAEMQEGHTFGDSWVEQLFTGMKRMDDIVLEGFYDDTATSGPDVVFGSAALGATRTLAVTYGSTKKTTVETVNKSYERTSQRGQLHRFKVTLSPTGAPSEA